MRLAKYLAHAGVASRRAAEGLVAEGRVSVGGQTARDPARDVDETSDVRVDGRAVAPEPVEVWAVNKPPGVVSTAADTHGRPTVLDLVPAGRRLYPVGRLDADSRGLLLLTNDGELAHRLTHPRFGVPKIYRAAVRPRPVPDVALRRLREGVQLDDGPTGRAEIRQVASGVLEITVREGRKRQIRRMLEVVGHRVEDLERVAIGPLVLGRLGEGHGRRLSPVEIERLRAAAGSGEERTPAPERRPRGPEKGRGWAIAKGRPPRGGGGERPAQARATDKLRRSSPSATGAKRHS
jgi:23S rRNA pseudouridine2605 synthase